MSQIFQMHLQRLFGETATITDVERTDQEVFFSLPVNQKQDFPQGVTIVIWGIEGRKVRCSMNEISLEGQLALMYAMQRAGLDLTPQKQPRKNISPIKALMIALGGIGATVAVTVIIGTLWPVVKAFFS